MKSVRTFLFLLISSSFCMAQEELLPVDEQGKFIYYELIDAKGMQKEQLRERINAFFKQSSKDLNLKIISGDTLLVAIGKLIISKTLLVMTHPSGEIRYYFSAEAKDNKFRFWLSDFIFIPYQRDRYGNFVAGTNKGVPLESNPSKLNTAQWKEYQIEIAKYAVQFAQSFKNYMAGKTSNVIEIKAKTIIKKEWK